MPAFKQLYPVKRGHHNGIFTHLYQRRTIIIQLIYFNQLVKIDELNDYCSALIEEGKDSIMVATLNGVKLLKGGHIDAKFATVLPNDPINCLQYSKPFLLAGTSEKGFF